jgi:hypothetical protein
VTLSFGESKLKLPVKDNVGQTVTWKDLAYSFDINSESMKTTDLEVALFDKNMLRSDVLIGKCPSISLTKSVAENGIKGVPVVLQAELPPDRSGKPSGRVEIELKIDPPRPKDDDLKVNSNFVNGYLFIRKVICSNLRNTETMGTLDPYVVLQLGEEKLKLPTRKDAGADCVWDHLDFKPSVTAAVVQTGSIQVQVWDGDNLLKDDLVGEASVRLVSAGVEIGAPVELRCELQSKNTKPGSGNSGVVVILASVHPPDRVIAPPSASMPALPETFKEGTIFISSIQAFGLKNTELFGKQDPFVVVKVGDFFNSRTAVLKDSGSDLIWSDLDFRIKVRPEFIKDGFIEFSVVDENNILKNTTIGTGRTPIRRLAARLGKEQKHSVTVEDAKGKVVGRLEVGAEMRETIPDADKKLPEGFVSGLLHIVRIQSHGLKNLELFGKQDPYIKLKCGAWQARTYTQNEAGGDVLWDFLDFRADVTAAELMSGKAVLAVEAMEDDTIVDKSIGTGVALLDKVRTIGEEVELNIELRDSSDKASGRLTVWVVLEERPPEGDYEVSKDFTNGYMHIRRVCVFELANTEWFGKADPYVQLKFGAFNEKTNPLKDKGGDAIWDYLDFKTDITADILKSEQLVVTVKDLNSSLVGDTVIGSGSVFVKKGGANVGKDVEISVPLTNAKGKPAGRAVVYLVVNPPENTNYVLKEGFKFGTFNVVRIQTFDLKNTELFGEADPYIVLKLGPWTDKTYTKQDAGGTVLWDHLDMRCDVTDEVVTTAELEISAWDENLASKDKLIGTAVTRIIKAGASVGSEVELPVKLLDDKGKPAGRVVVYCSVIEDAIMEIPESFKRGELHIKRVSATNLKNTEWFSGTPNCYCKLELDDFNAVTPTVDGLNPVWDRTDYKTIVSAKTVKGREVKVQLWNKNSLRADVLIGEADIPLRRSGSKLNGDIDIFSDLFDVKGAVVGRSTLLVRLSELPPDPEANLGLPATFTHGIVEIVKVQCFGLKNKEFLGKQVSLYFVYC